MMTIGRLHKLLGKMVEQGHARKPVCADKGTFFHPLESDGITILPELAVLELTPQQQRLVKRLKQPAPARQVSLVTHRDHVKTRLISTLREEILGQVPRSMQQLRNKKVVDITL